MLTKAEKTSQFIIETSALYFNKHGFTGTSMSDLCNATGLTKGAIYGNFKNKEDLAVCAFNYLIRKAIGEINTALERQDSAIDKLIAFTLFYRDYYDRVIEYGGCPILNVGVDSLNHNQRLYKIVMDEVNKLTLFIEKILEQGKAEGSIKESIDARKVANKVYAQIQGSIFMAAMMDDKEQITSMLDHVDHTIASELMT
jgi:AcrR family transcriptional regulator